MNYKQWLSVGLVVSFSQSAAWSQVTDRSFSPGVSIPDNNSLGVTADGVVSGLAFTISDLNVSLNITASTGFNGDLFVTLTHQGSGRSSTLLNRPGKNSAGGLGFADSGGLNITLDDEAGTDAHIYRSPGPATTSTITGTYQPDARTDSPANVTNDTSNRTAFLSVFDGISPNGTWTIFASDLSGGGTHTLSGFTLSFTPVPEPHEYALISGGLLLLFAAGRRLRMKRPVAA